MAGLLLDARDLRKTFTSGRGGSRRTVAAVRGVDLAIEAGGTHGLVGESGSGKSTLARILLRLLEPDSGSVTFRGQDLLALRGSQLRQVRRQIQLIHQDPFSSVDPRFRVRDIVAEAWDIHGLYERAERRRRADELLERVGIDPTLGDRRPASFSGGQLQRVGIARALALEPSLIICDEPVSALDVSVQGQVLNLLLDLQQERGVSYLFIAHDLSVVRHMSDRVSVMYAGRIVETGRRDEIFARAAHPYTQALLSAMTHADGVAASAEPAARAEMTGLLTGCAFRPRCPIAQARCAVEDPVLIDRGQGHPVACWYPDLAASKDQAAGGSASADGSASAAHAWVDRDDGHVGHEVDEGDEESGDDADAHDEGRVQPPEAH